MVPPIAATAEEEEEGAVPPPPAAAPWRRRLVYMGTASDEGIRGWDAGTAEPFHAASAQGHVYGEA